MSPGLFLSAQVLFYQPRYFFISPGTFLSAQVLFLAQVLFFSPGTLILLSEDEGDIKCLKLCKIFNKNSEVLLFYIQKVLYLHRFLFLLPQKACFSCQ